MANQITRWNPWRDMVAMQNAMDRLFDETWREFGQSGDNGNSNWLALDVHEDGDHFVVHTDLPGVKPENIQVQVHDGLLTIEAEIPEHVIEDDKTRSLVRERRYGRFSRSVQLPQSVDNEHVEAEYADGVLTLTLPKAEDAKPRSIPVKSRNMIASNN
ncbi:MAG: Hsp20/alpha crystallin family protein [Anaerolineae bacterium]|nr:Hsp20/alpha crystallin family protein [Anaerolineae bacterium]